MTDESAARVEATSGAAPTIADTPPTLPAATGKAPSTASADHEKSQTKQLTAPTVCKTAIADVAAVANKADATQELDWRNQRGKLTEIQPGLLLSDFFAARFKMPSLSRELPIGELYG